MDIVKVEHLVKKYADFSAVSDISFNVLQGQIFAFLGPNGAGKSTTMNIMSTLQAPTSGSVKIDDCSSSLKIRQRIGFVFQENTLDDNLSVYDNLYYRGLLYYKDKKALKLRLLQLSNDLELTSILTKIYKNCSGGQKRLVMIARAIIHNPKLIILDEPTSGLDPRIRQKVWNLLIKLKEKQNLTIFFSSHYIDEATLADVVCIMNQGKIVMMDTPSKIISQFGRQKLTMLLDDDEVSVSVKDAQDAIQILNNKKKTLKAFECTNSSLEDIFISYTEKLDSVI